MNYILEGHESAGTLPKKGAMVKSIVTSTLSTKMAKAYGVEMFETLTGFKNICGKIPYLHENGYTYLFGYEESVGYAGCEDIRDKDGISAGMLVTEAAAYYRKQGKTLLDVDHIIDYVDGYEDLPPHNALRFFVDEDTWFAVRPSGTEPKIKMYFYSSDETMQKAKEKNEAIKKAVLDLINAVE